MDRNAEFKFMVSFAMQSCLHYDLDVDTASYDSYIRELWKAVAADEEDTADWSDFDSFGNFMCRYLV